MAHVICKHNERYNIYTTVADGFLFESSISLNELEKYSLELSRKRKILGISKSDMLDNELKLEIEASLPIEIPHIFFSSVTGENIMQMKDILWDSLNS